MKISQLALKVAEDLDAAVYVYSGSIDQDGYGKLIESMQLSELQPSRTNSLLILTTNGGAADAAYLIARTLQQTSEKVILCIPAQCKSAGTLVALGAHEILMNSLAEFGPLDVQLVQRDEIGQRRSGLVVRTALAGLADETFDIYQKVMLNIKMASKSAISFEVASRLAAEMAVGVMAPVYAQISPDALGNDLRDLRVATAYGDRLARVGRNTKPDTVRRLVEDYPAHEFIIDQSETAELFNVVDEISGDLEVLISELGEIVYLEQQEHCVWRLDRLENGKNDGTQQPAQSTQHEDPGLDEERKEERKSNKKGLPRGPKARKDRGAASDETKG